jgi:hypothetical protein
MFTLYGLEVPTVTAFLMGSDGVGRAIASHLGLLAAFVFGSWALMSNGAVAILFGKPTFVTLVLSIVFVPVTGGLIINFLVPRSLRDEVATAFMAVQLIALLGLAAFAYAQSWRGRLVSGKRVVIAALLTIVSMAILVAVAFYLAGRAAGHFADIGDAVFPGGRRLRLAPARGSTSGDVAEPSPVGVLTQGQKRHKDAPRGDKILRATDGQICARRGR